MSTRLQVVVSEEELAEIRAAAEERRMNVSEWVRLVLRQERERRMRGRSASVHEPVRPYGPTDPSGLPRDRRPVEVDVHVDLLTAVRDRYRLPNDRAAIEFALRRAAVRPMTRDEALAMEGVGWDGDLAAMRRGDPGGLW